MRTWLVAAFMLCSALGGVRADARTLGYQLDISRGKVPTMSALFRIVDVLAGLGYNQFQLYTEHTFAYAKHEVVWREASPMTPDEVRQLDRYCASHGIELVPNQNSFGHLEHWLRHSEYNHLADHPNGGALVKRWGDYVTPNASTLNPIDPKSIEFLSGLYDELLPCFKSRLFNVGCDETIELEDANFAGRSAPAIREKGAAQVYLDFLFKVHALVKSRGHTMMFWADIALLHPEMVPKLPKDAIALVWGYEADHPFDKEAKVLHDAGRRFMMCPGTSAWNSISGRTNNMLGNIDGAIAAGEKYGAEGYLLADWGDGGHPNAWLVSLPAIVYLAHRVRGETMTRDQLAAEIDRITGVKCGAALLAYGDVWESWKGRHANGTEPFAVLHDGPRYRPKGDVTPETIAAGLAQCKYAKSLLPSTLDSTSPTWVGDGFRMMDLLYRAVELRLKNPDLRNFRASFEPEYRRLWLRHNRSGGLASSLYLLFGP